MMPMSKTTPPLSLRPELRMTGCQARELAAALIAAAIEAEAAEAAQPPRTTRRSAGPVDPQPADLLERKADLQADLVPAVSIPGADALERSTLAADVEVRGGYPRFSAPPSVLLGEWLAAVRTTHQPPEPAAGLYSVQVRAAGTHSED